MDVKPIHFDCDCDFSVTNVPSQFSRKHRNKHTMQLRLERDNNFREINRAMIAQ